MERAGDDVVLCGAGPVGLLIAVVLARAGIPVTVVEAEPGIAESPRAIVCHSPTLELPDGLGLLADARERGILKQDYRFRRLGERDPRRRRADLERLPRIDGDPDLQRDVLLVPEQLRSRPYSFAA